jgi:hypothetical protein
MNTIIYNIKNNIIKLRNNIPLSNNKLYIISILIIIIIITIIIRIIIINISYKKINPTFYVKKKNSKLKSKISSKLIYNPPNGYGYTWNFWIYIDNWNYKLNQKKHILTRGILEQNPQKCNPSIWISDKNNDLYFYIETEKNGTQKYILKDIPIKKWTMITVVLHTNEFEIYQNSKLVETYILLSLPKLNSEDVFINQWGGFSGYISKLTYYPNSITSTKIKNIYKIKPSYKNLLNSLFKIKNKKIKSNLIKNCKN